MYMQANIILLCISYFNNYEYWLKNANYSVHILFTVIL